MVTVGTKPLDTVYASVYILDMTTNNRPTNHATERAETRIKECGLSPRKVMECASDIADKVRDYGSVAVHMTTLPESHGEYWVESNGSQVWAVIRDGRVVTLMLRREDQPGTPDRLRVDHVMRLPQAA